MPQNYDKARTCVELCRFSYKMYAQTLKFPFDPFFEAYAKSTNNVGQVTRSRMMEYIHDLLKTPKKDDRRKLDPIQYNLEDAPNPRQSVVYRGGTKDSYIVFVPGTWDKKIKDYAGFNLEGKKLMESSLKSGNSKCGYFQGQTGMTTAHPNSGWTSFLGAVIYDPMTKTAYIVFRGSRSGNGTRAASRALFMTKGNPDWVTDMHCMKEEKPFNPDFDCGNLNERNKVKLASGFWKAYDSSKKSMEEAFKYAVNGCEVDTVCVTGHSLGGALAQCAYIHLCCSRSIQTRLNLKATAVIECYPIAAPPVCLGRETQHWISRNANASNVQHYYCPYDAVHACDLVIFSGSQSQASKVVDKMAPGISTFHFGSQLALNSNETFPDAHEPSTIWKALWVPEFAPKGFWQEFNLDIQNTKVNSVWDEDPIDRSAILDAINQSFNAADFKKRAEQWAHGISDGFMDRGKNKTEALDSIIAVSKEYFTDFKKENVAKQTTVIHSTNNNFSNTTSDTARCVYHTLFSGIAIQRLLSDFKSAPPKVLLSINIPKVDLLSRSRRNTI